jgi:pimeloyl-ACP methyl ester carboxylesterase
MGDGAKLLIAFHGFSDRAVIFSKIGEVFIQQDYTFCSVDLPYHGHTDWKEGAFNKKDFKAIVLAILLSEEKDSFDLMGYSFGARIVERLLFGFENKLNHIWLIAPDGLKTKWMFEISMIPKWIRHGAKSILNRPKWFLSILNFFHNHHLINDLIFSFTIKHLGRNERRERLFSYWISMDDFVIAPEKFKSKLLKSKIKTDVFFGTGDDIVPVSAGYWLESGIPSVTLHVMPGGHKLINSDLADYFRGILIENRVEKLIMMLDRASISKT